MHVALIVLLSNLVLCKCEMVPFVVGGGSADIQNFPYVAHLGIICVEIAENDSFICGSSIISQHITLTAAHCLFYCMENSTITVSVGHVDPYQGSLSLAQSFLIHENYCQQTVKNDIALVKLLTPIPFSATVSRVLLLKSHPFFGEAQIAGWGLVNEKHEKTTTILKFTQQLVMHRNECLDVVKKMPNGTFCAGSKTLRGYASVGDSGSPLVVQNYIQIGLVSFKKPDVSRSVVIYTDTSHFFKWIKKNSEKMLCAVD